MNEKTRPIFFRPRFRSVLVTAYVGEGTSIRELARSLGVSPSWLYRVMVRLGIPRRRPGRPKNEGINEISGT